MSELKINSIEVATWYATITMGCQIGYTDNKLSIDAIHQIITDIQFEIDQSLNVKLSAKVTPCSIVFMGQVESSVSIEFIQYPKFQYPVKSLKKAVLLFAEKLIIKAQQNRIVIVFQKKTLMLEINNEIDPKIKVFRIS